MTTDNDEEVLVKQLAWISGLSEVMPVFNGTIKALTVLLVSRYGFSLNKI